MEFAETGPMNLYGPDNSWQPGGARSFLLSGMARGGIAGDLMRGAFVCDYF